MKTVRVLTLALLVGFSAQALHAQEANETATDASETDVAGMSLDVCPTDYRSFPEDAPTLSCGCSAEATESGSIRGANPYHESSSLCRAAVHAGAVDPEGGEIVVEPESAEFYPAVEQHGVASRNRSSGGKGFRVVVDEASNTDDASDTDQQSGAATNQGNGDQVFASGRHNSGQAIGEIDGLVVDGDRLTVKMSFRPAKEGQEVNTTTVARAKGSDYEHIYLVSGDKKYLLVQDSQNIPLATEVLSLSGSGDVVGMWYGVFPNPPEGQNVTLYMPDMEPIGPFTVPEQ